MLFVNAHCNDPLAGVLITRGPYVVGMIRGTDSRRAHDAVETIQTRAYGIVMDAPTKTGYCDPMDN